jgi:serine/threonine protein kinase
MPPVKNKKSDLNQISHYSLQAQLVDQAISTIYQATDENTGKPVFLVTLRPEAVTGDLPDRFLRRAETAAQLTHETILPVIEHGMVEKRPYAILPFQVGHFLAEHPLFAAAPDPADRNHVLRAIELVKQLAAGLAAAHPTGLFHHDLRPENIFIDANGKPLLLDLVVPPTPPPPAVAAAEGPSQLDYRSPEQLAGKTLSGRSNIFSLGVLLYRLLAGQLPPLPVSEWDIFEHKGTAREMPLNELRPGLTEATYTAVRDSIWQKEWSRYETAADQEKSLEQALAAESAPPPPPSTRLAAAGQTCQPAKDSQDCCACCCGPCFAAFGDAVGRQGRAAARPGVANA